MSIFDKVGPLGEKLKGAGGLKNPIGNFQNIGGELEDFAEAGQTLLKSFFGLGGGNKLEYPLDVSGNPAYAATVKFEIFEYKSPQAGKSQKSHVKQQEDNLKRTITNEQAGLGQVDDFSDFNPNAQAANDANAQFLGASNQPIQFVADEASAPSVAGGDDAAALNNLAVKDTVTVTQATQTSSSTNRGGMNFFKKNSEPSIIMYFPPSMAFVDGVQYDTNSPLGQLGATALAGMEGGMTGLEAGLKGLQDEGQALLDTVLGKRDNLTSGAINSLKLAAAKVNDTFNPSQGIKNAVSLVNRFTLNPNVRAIFRGVNIREFAFQFKLIATSPQEANAIQKIIKQFRKELYPRGFSVPIGEASADLGFHFPNAFKISFKYNGRRNRNIPKIKMAYLRSFSHTINPTGGGFRKDGQPNEIDISMSFVEHETLKQKDILKGF